MAVGWIHEIQGGQASMKKLRGSVRMFMFAVEKKRVSSGA
jgi:hypothetical protein